VHTLHDGVLPEREAERKELIEESVIERRGKCREGREGLELRGEEETFAGPCVIEGPQPEPVVYDDEGLLFLIQRNMLKAPERRRPVLVPATW